MDAGWNLPNTMLKGAMFLPTAPLMLPQSLSQFPADSAFIERAARFSCFNGGNFGDMLNPFGVPGNTGLYSRGVGMMQGPEEAFTGSGLKSVSGGQAQKNALSVGDAPKDVSMTVDHLAFDDNPLKSQRRSEGLVKSHDELKQGVGKSGSESDEAEFSGDGGQEEPSILDENGGEMFSKSLGSKKRKKNGQTPLTSKIRGSNLLIHHCLPGLEPELYQNRKVGPWNSGPVKKLRFVGGNY